MARIRGFEGSLKTGPAGGATNDDALSVAEYDFNVGEVTQIPAGVWGSRAQFDIGQLRDGGRFLVREDKDDAGGQSLKSGSTLAIQFRMKTGTGEKEWTGDITIFSSPLRMTGPDGYVDREVSWFSNAGLTEGTQT